MLTGRTQQRYEDTGLLLDEAYGWRLFTELEKRASVAYHRELGRRMGIRDLRAYARAVICDACRESEHDRCPGGSWCDCQHRPPGPVEPVTGPPGE